MSAIREYSPHMSVGEQRWLERKNQSRVAAARSDWNNSLDMIAWEHETFHNDIPFSGDTRTLLATPEGEQNNG